VPDIELLRYRKQLQTERAFYWIVIIALLVALIAIIFSEKQCAIQVGDRTVAWVDGIKTAQHVIETLRQEYVNSITLSFGEPIAKTFRFKEEPTFVRRSVEGPRLVSENEALRRLRNAVTPQVKGWVIYIAQKPVVGLPTRAMAEETLFGIKLKLTGGNVEKAKKSKLEGGSKIVEEYISLKQMRPKAEEAIAYLLGSSAPAGASGEKLPYLGPAGSGTYTVQPGDTGMAIAHRLGTTIEELEKLNPHTEWSKLHPGDILHVPTTAAKQPNPSSTHNSSPAGGNVAKPSPSPGDISITETKVITVRESIPFTTVKRRSLKLKPGETEIRRKGERGVREVKYKVYYQNGKVVRKQEIAAKIVKQPVTQEIWYGAGD